MLQESGIRRAPSQLPAKPPRTTDYLPLRIAPSGMGPLLMASFVFYMSPQVVAFVSPPAAARMAAFLCALLLASPCGKREIYTSCPAAIVSV